MSAGDVHDDDMTDPLDAFLDDLRAAAAEAPAPPAGDALRALFRDGAAPQPAPLPATPGRRRRRLGIAVAAAVGGVSFGGLGAAGALPEPVQDTVADMVEVVGVDLPDGSPDPTTTTTTSTTTPGHTGRTRSTSPTTAATTAGPTTTVTAVPLAPVPRPTVTEPGRSDEAPGRSGGAPGTVDDDRPGRSEHAPGQSERRGSARDRDDRDGRDGRDVRDDRDDEASVPRGRPDDGANRGGPHQRSQLFVTKP